MAADYCFLKFICVHKSFKKHFPHLSLGVPAHQTKPPVWFSTAVNFAALISNSIAGRKATTAQCPVFHSLSPSELSEAGVACRASCVWSSPLFFFLALQMLPGPPEVEHQVSQTEGSEQGERCYRWAELSAPARSYGRGAQGSLGSCCWSTATWEQGQLLLGLCGSRVNPRRGAQMGDVPRGEHLAAPSWSKACWCCWKDSRCFGDAAGRVRGALGVVAAPPAQHL